MNWTGDRNLLAFGAILSAVTAGLLAGTPTSAAVVISADKTDSMSCMGAVCQPTAKNAVLNVGDLETMLASGNVEVTTTGSGVQAKDIAVEASLSWSGPSQLSLVASRLIEIEQSVSVTGTGGVSFANDGALEALAFGSSGNVTFSSLTSSLSINGAHYKLVDTVKALAQAIAKKPSGNFALATSYDAKKDQVYDASPVSSDFDGIFEGLGNSISNLKMHNRTQKLLGMFAELLAEGTIRDLGLTNESVDGRTLSTELSQDIGGIVGDNFGKVFRSFTSGKVFTGCGCRFNLAHMGGIAGANYVGGTIEESYSSATVRGGADVGGLVGLNGANIAQCFATGTVSGQVAGGLVGDNMTAINESYATGSATGKYWAGGLVGTNERGTDSQSYSTGEVSASESAGGFVGVDKSASGSLSDTYWDISTSSITNPDQGAGNISDDPGITGLTTAQLQSGLPDGFDPKVWVENSSVNDGLPYLIAIPPQ